LQLPGVSFRAALYTSKVAAVKPHAK